MGSIGEFVPLTDLTKSFIQAPSVTTHFVAQKSLTLRCIDQNASINMTPLYVFHHCIVSNSVFKGGILRRKITLNSQSVGNANSLLGKENRNKSFQERKLEKKLVKQKIGLFP